MDDHILFPEHGAGPEETKRQRDILMRRIGERERRRRLRRVFGRAGSMAALLVLGLGLFWTVRHRKDSVRAGLGEKVHKTLPDGSVVILNSDTRIRYPRDLGRRRSRDVWMDGEAFFKVAKDPGGKPFVVHAGHFDVEVTGTQFNLRSGTEGSSILLTEGSVTVRLPDGSTRRMVPGDYFASSDDTTSAAEKPTAGIDRGVRKPEDVLSWLDRSLVFEDTPLAEVAREIGVRYQVGVVTGSERIARLRVTGILPNDNLEILLKSLEATVDVRVRRDGATIHIDEAP